ncbi:MAG TPA: iron-containing alcohol dehydrogenase, partial [Calditrichaeota bacterium]|nr:iron-containing alcohol dehydrogenase [Calditrichota bacterium]
VDAIAHILEFYFTTRDPATPVQDRFMEGLVINIMESCDRVLVNSKDYAARADLMWCATLALNGWTAAGLGLVGFPMHMIEHSLSALYNVPHGAGLSVVVPAWMKFQAEQNPTKFNQFAERVFQISAKNDSEKASTGIRQLKDWFSKSGSPTSLAELKIPLTDIPKISENALKLAKIWRLRDYDQKMIEEILLLCTDG